MSPDTIFVEQINNLPSVIYLPIATVFFMSSINLICTFIAARLSTKRVMANHIENEKKLFESFKIDITRQVEKMNGKINRVEEKSVSWKTLVEFSDKVEKSISRIHDKREELQNNIMKNISDIHVSIQNLSIEFAKNN